MSAVEPLPSEDEDDLNPHGQFAHEQGSEVPLGWKPTAAEPVPVVRCVQIKRDGERCKNWSIRGYTKCRKHSGPGKLMQDGNVAKYAEAVIEAARLRLVDSSDMALDTLLELAQPGTSEGIRLKAATEVLDRAGIRGGFDIKVENEITINPASVIAERLAKLREGAEAVERMKNKQLEVDDPDEQVIDGEVIEEDDDDGKLF